MAQIRGQINRLISVAKPPSGFGHYLSPLGDPDRRIPQDTDLIRPDLNQVPFLAGKLIRGHDPGTGEEHSHRGDIVGPSEEGDEFRNRPPDPGGTDLPA